MKKIEEKYTIEQVRVEFEAVDGKRFRDEVECQNYEETAECAITAAVHDMAVITATGWDLFPGGMEDHTVYVVVPKTDEDIKALRTFEALIRKKGGCGPGESEIKKEYKGKALFFYVGYESEWCDIRPVDDVLNKITEKL